MTLEVRRRANMPAGSRVILAIPSDVGIRLPLGGTTQNNPLLQIAATGISKTLSPEVPRHNH
jgi:hypothetical protein